ncbi:MAG: ABC-F family ATP-binding cassette domain-containing protein [Sphingobacteriaceae bacterium]|nr:ABC-F family ATP-binding cassette domain-containing protein [Cytophagaceae bacterium]
MNLLSADNLAKNFGERWLFKNLTFGLSQGDKVALVGRNGTGKTSLLDVLAGLQPPDEGAVALRRDLRLGYLNQQPVFEESLSVMDTLFALDTPVVRAVKAYENALAHHQDAAINLALEAMETYQAWDYEAQVKQILGKLGIEETDFGKPVGTLSGGQRKRVALARVLLSEPDLLILDEPTNHLDLTSIEWLEGYLSTANVTLLLVTHDRYFLDRVCSEILELTDGKLYRHKGSYAQFLEKQVERETAEAASVDKARNLYRRELDWMRRQPKARGTKAQYRIDAFHEVKEKASQKKDNSTLELNVKMARQGSKILEIEHLSKTLNAKKLIENFSYTFRKGDRLGIVGPNGVGKSTFLNLVTGHLPPDAGSVVAGETTKFGYYRQEEFPFSDDQRVIEVVKEVAEVITLGTGETITASQFLQQFLFDPKKQYDFVGKLSGGERRRLQLMRVLLQSPNFLILDEPTNDLDIPTLNVLEEFLDGFGGCLVLVSHDRYFMDRLVEHLFVFEGEGRIRDFPGNYTDYRESLQSSVDSFQVSEPSTKSTQQFPSNNPQPPTTRRKLSFKEQKEFETLEKDIASLEEQKASLTERLNDGADNYQQISLWSKEIEEINHVLQEKELRWLELSEMG